MHSLLIISQNKKQREAYALRICTKQQIDPLDISIIESEQSLGIADVRNMQKKIFLKPFKSKEKAIIIQNAHTATTETQNALLKVLEEPPANTFVILTAATENAFLHTILSRCKIITLEETDKDISQEELEKLQIELKNLTSENIGYKLKLAQDLAKDKEQTLKWLVNSIKITRNSLLENVNDSNTTRDYIFALESLQKAYTIVHTTNVNVRFLLESLFLNFM